MAGSGDFMCFVLSGLQKFVYIIVKSAALPWLKWIKWNSLSMATYSHPIRIFCDVISIAVIPLDYY